MYLLDTNIILELLLDQEKADEVEQFMRSTRPDSLNLSEFSLYSLGIALLSRGMYDTFLQSVDDLLIAGRARLLRIGVWDMQSLVTAVRKFSLAIVSFDNDFDRAELGRKTPAEVIS